MSNRPRLLVRGKHFVSRFASLLLAKYDQNGKKKANFPYCCRLWPTYPLNSKKTPPNDMPDKPKNRKLDIKLNPACAHDRARRAWGQGLMSGLPFAEFILLAGFLMAACMFLTLGNGHTADAGDTPAPPVTSP